MSGKTKTKAKAKANLKFIQLFLGTIFDYNTAMYTKQKFEEFGLDTEMNTFKALISYPVSRSVSLLSPVQYNLTLKEDPVSVDPTSNNSNIMMVNVFIF